MTAHIERAQLLIQQSRYELAEEQLRLGLAEQPDSAVAHSLLGIVLSAQKKIRAALHEAEKGIVLDPDNSYSYYVLAAIHHDHEQLKQADEAIQQAIGLNPFEAEYFALRASIYLQQKDWKDAVELAEKALSMDAENVEASNIRAMALVKLGRRSEAGQTIDNALARDPENAVTHANQGWTLLEGGDHKAAMEHFQEALRLDPNLDWAREGIVEALKAKNPIYRVMLRYFFWMSRLKSKIQWMVILGAVFGIQVIEYLSETYPGFAPFGNTIFGLYIAFVLLTWIADPVFDLLLRLNKFGRLALSEEQLKASNLVGLALFSGVCLLIAGVITGNVGCYIGAGFSAAMIVPLSGIYRARPGKSRVFLAGYAIVLGLLTITGSALRIMGSEAGNGLLGFMFLGLIAYSWIANWLIMRS
ncbi:MAG: tetratricopeptide repeat protein [Calditrichia bacterium]